LIKFFSYYLRVILNLKIIVCGSIGFGGIDDIRNLQRKIKENGLTIIDHISEEGMDYSDITDFRDHQDLSREIVEHDLRFVEEADIIVALVSKPSFGTAIEMYIAKQKGKHVIVLADRPIPTPWPIFLSTKTVKTEEDLLIALKEIEQKSKDQLE